MSPLLTTFFLMALSILLSLQLLEFLADRYGSFTFRVDGAGTGDFTNSRLKPKIGCDIIRITNRDLGGIVMIGFWIFMLIMDLLVPFTMIGFGKLFLNKAPKNINYTFGYRTTMSMKNQDTWQFAHKYCGKLWFRGGLILLPVSIIPLLFVLGGEIETVAAVGTVVCFAQIVPLVGSIIPTEIALKKVFNKNGKRKIS